MKRSQDSPGDIDAYIAGFPADVQKRLEQMRTAIRAEAPDAEEAIKYGIPTFVLHGNLVHFAAFKSHIGFYPTPSGIETFARELASYENAKGSVRFPFDQPLPLSLVRRIVAFRVKEARAKTTGQKRRSRAGEPHRGQP